ncbi:hypothetical protein AX16_001862 [Volvariella volvacea WC 439]|nr:hypothetical protein AX16_001862 [Volvariella volvacea WC 439]
MAQTTPQKAYDAVAVYLLCEKSSNAFGLFNPYMFMLAGILPNSGPNAGLPLSALVPRAGVGRDRSVAQAYPNIMEALDVAKSAENTEGVDSYLSAGMIGDAIEYLNCQTTPTTVRHLIIVATSAPNLTEEDSKPLVNNQRMPWKELALKAKQASVLVHVITSTSESTAALWTFFDECIQCGAFAEDALPFPIDRSRVQMRLSSAIKNPTGKAPSPSPSQPRKPQRSKKRHEPYATQSRVAMPLSPTEGNLVEQIQMRFGLHHSKRGRKETKKPSEPFCRDAKISGPTATKEIFIPDAVLNMNHSRAGGEPMPLISPRTPSSQFTPSYIPKEEQLITNSPSMYLSSLYSTQETLSPSTPLAYSLLQHPESTASTPSSSQGYQVAHPQTTVGDVAPNVSIAPASESNQYWYPYLQPSVAGTPQVKNLAQPPTMIYRHEDTTQIHPIGHGSSFGITAHSNSSTTTEPLPPINYHTVSPSFGYDPSQFTDGMASCVPSPSGTTFSSSLLTPEEDGAYHLTTGQSLVLSSTSSTPARDPAIQQRLMNQSKPISLSSAQSYDNWIDHEPFSFAADYFTATNALAMRYFRTDANNAVDFNEINAESLPMFGPPPSDTTGAIYNSHFESGQQANHVARSNFVSYTLSNATSLAAMGWAG